MNGIVDVVIAWARVPGSRIDAQLMSLSVIFSIVPSSASPRRRRATRAVTLEGAIPLAHPEYHLPPPSRRERAPYAR
ncbi:hypothetical protein GCM10028867_39230 [Nocardioides pacificus]